MRRSEGCRPLRLAFLGTPAVSVIALTAVVGAGHEIALVVSRPDRRRGRGSTLMASPVKAAAIELGIEVTDKVADVVDVGADLAVVVAFGQIIRPAVLDVLPMVNLHFSLLPRWRGAAPVERAILAGDPQTGVCLMEMEAGLDTGGVYARAEVDIGGHETAEELKARLAGIGAQLLVDWLGKFDGVIGPTRFGSAEPQRGEPVYAHKIEVEELRLDWALGAVELERVVRVGRAWTTWRGKRLIVNRAHAADAAPPTVADATLTAADAAPTAAIPGALLDADAATGDGVLRLIEVQPEGRRAVDARDWVRGTRPKPDKRLGS